MNDSVVGCPPPRRESAVRKIQRSVRDFGHPSRCKCDLPSSGVLRSVNGGYLPTFRDNLSVPTSRFGTGPIGRTKMSVRH